MQNTLQTFTNKDFGTIRTITENGNIYFCGSDAAKALGYAKPRNAINRHCKGALKRGTPTNGGIQALVFIPESDLYRLVIGSTLPSAQAFEKWVMEEVLPSIRKHGAYLTPQTLQESIQNPDFLIGVLTALKEEQAKTKALEQQAEANQPLIEYASLANKAVNACLVREFAKILSQNGISFGEQKLYAWLRENGYLIKTGQDKNLPYQKHIEADLFRIKRWVGTRNGYTLDNSTTLITQKGQQHLFKKLQKEFAELQNITSIGA